MQGEQECATCHRADTPAAFKAWEDGPHGLALVKCVVCHGSTGSDFARRPPAERCRGCHGQQVDALAAKLADYLPPEQIARVRAELSVSPQLVPEIKDTVRRLDSSACQQLALDLQSLNSAQQVRARLQADAAALLR